ncbi:DUF2637 domain-containing protein [Rathayibacter soli]|uniref:DUF2637 domain-containing protein n=1 Tax=Rathayibacter soli TaxID=3144168 RepID=UPI0027E4229B|nr:DUF2637 domain-containing protein [Glaciibacter superstes]
MTTAVAGTVFIAAGAFWLSFTALSDLAERSGISSRQAWAWPLIVDGIIVVATVSVVALDEQHTAWYPWLLLMAGALVSVTANALHAVVSADADVPGALAASVAAVPPLVLLAITHLTVILTRPVPGLPATEGAGSASAADTEFAGAPVRRELAELLHAEGLSNKAIARTTGVHPSTVGRWLASSAPTALETTDIANDVASHT